MILTDRVCHTATIDINVQPRVAFDFLKDGLALGKWTFGSWETTQDENGLISGLSLFGGDATYIRIYPYPDNLQIDYAVGKDPDQLLTRITARIMDGAIMGATEQSCFVTMISWRTGDVADSTWRLICAAHEAEVFRLKHILEQRKG